MQALIQGNPDVKKLIPSIPDSRKNYKLSRFVLQCEIECGLLLHNTLSGELLFLSPEESESLEGIQKEVSESISELISHAFLIPEALDETRRVEQLRAILHKRLVAEGNINHYNILPTTDCNARCFYCYESDIKHVNMTEETASHLVDYIAVHSGNKPVQLHWYGGEPTLGQKRIDQICSGLNERNIVFHSDMVSNSYLFTHDLVRHAKELWNLQEIQITLDGTESVYNRTKAFQGVSDNPYHRVLRNIGFFLDEGIRVNIRLNMDAHNVENLDTLIDELEGRFHGRKGLAIYIRQLKEHAGFQPILHTENDLYKLRQDYLLLQRKLEELGWSQIWNFSLPSFHTNTCMADNPTFVQCTPDGIFSRCEDKIYDSAVGTLAEGITDEAQMNWWRERTMYPECENCALYPSCTHLLKHCPTRGKTCDHEEREHRLELCRNAMLKAYQNWKETGDHES